MLFKLKNEYQNTNSTLVQTCPCWLPSDWHVEVPRGGRWWVGAWWVIMMNISRVIILIRCYCNESLPQRREGVGGWGPTIKHVPSRSRARGTFWNKVISHQKPEYRTFQHLKASFLPPSPMLWYFSSHLAGLGALAGYHTHWHTLNYIVCVWKAFYYDVVCARLETGAPWQ